MVYAAADFHEEKQMSYSNTYNYNSDGFGESNETKQQESNNASTQSRALVARGHWRPAEDKRLKEIVALYGPQNWNLIADKLGAGRSGKSCRLRWFNQLDPRINRRAFTEDEEERLLVAHRLYGSKWAMIAATFFPGRTDNAVKNHWHVIMARKYRHNNRPSRRILGHQPNFCHDGLMGSAHLAEHWAPPQVPAISIFNHSNKSTQEGVSFSSSAAEETNIAPQFIDFLGVGGHYE